MLSRDRLVQVFLHGALGDEFGAEHAFAINTPREAVRALDVNFPGFRAAMLKHQRYGLFVDGDWRDGDDAAVLPVSKQLHIVPIIEGRGPMLAPLILAAVPALGVVGSEIVAGLIVTALLWGVSMLFFSPPAAEKGADKSESYMFSGAENTTAQGAAVPVIYGRCFVGSVVISAGLSVGDQQIKGRSGRSMLVGRSDEPQRTDFPDAISHGPGVPATPPLVLQEIHGIGSRIFRVGPEGWRHVGTVALIEPGGTHRDVDVFIPPDAGQPYRWDYWRGFERYQPGEQGMLEA